MGRYIVKRLGMMMLTLLVIVVLVFFLMHAIPGGPFTAQRELPPEVEAALVEKYNLNASLGEQLLDYLAGLVRGDLGPSFKYPGMRVNDFIQKGFPVSARLGGVTILFVLLASIPMGIVAALNSGKWQDMMTMVIATIGVTIPSFVIATVLMYLFSYKLGWLPAFGLDSPMGNILPVVALGGYSRYSGRTTYERPEQWGSLSLMS